MTTDSITRFAQHYRIEAAAVLVQIAKDESAPASARAQAAQQILAYSDGKPSVSKAISAADLDLLTDDQRNELLDALLTRYYASGGLKELIKQAVEQAVSQEAGVSKPRFKRGPPPAPLGPQVAQRTRDPGGTHTRKELSALAYAAEEHPHVWLAAPASENDGEARFRNVPEAESRADTLDSSISQRCEVDTRADEADSSTLQRCNIDSRAATRFGSPAEPNNNVLPFGMKYENPLLRNNPDSTPSSTPPIPSNGIHPDVVRRSAKPTTMAMDLAFQGYSPRSRW